MGDHLTRCERCEGILASGKEYADHMDYHRRNDKAEAVACATSNVIDRWEQLPNSIRTCVGFSRLESALVRFRDAVELNGDK